MGTIADSVVAVEIPREFMVVRRHYRDFSQTSDNQVRELLQRAEKNLTKWTAA